MTSPFTTRPGDDPTNVLQWLAGRGAGRGTAPAATLVPAEQVDAVEARETILPAEPMPVPTVEKAEPVKPTHCANPACGKPLATLRSAASRYCDRYCAKAARKARATELPR
jgi:hypothetical protein